MDFDAQLHVSFKSSKYSMKNSEAVLFKGRFRTHVFQRSFLNRIVALRNDPPEAIRITDEYCYLCLVRKLMNFILINLIPIKKDFYGLVTVFSIRDFITLSNKLINKLYDNYTKHFNEFKSRFRIFLYLVFFHFIVYFRQIILIRNPRVLYKLS